MSFELEIKRYQDMGDIEGELTGRISGFQRPEFSDPAVEAVVQSMDEKLDRIGLDLWFASIAEIDNPDAQAIVAEYARFMLRYDNGPGGPGTNRLYYKQSYGPEHELQPHASWHKTSSKESLGLLETKSSQMFRSFYFELEWLNQLERYKEILDGMPLEQISEALLPDTVWENGHVTPGFKPMPPTITADMIDRIVPHARNARKRYIAEELAWIDDTSRDDQLGFWVPRSTVFSVLEPEDCRPGMSAADAHAILEAKILDRADA